MGQFLDELGNWGADTEGAMRNLYADEKYYAELVRAFARDSRIRSLEIAMRAQDYADAFTLSHGLMNEARKLGLAPLSEPLSLFADRLRTRNWKDAPNFYGAVQEQISRLQDLVRRSDSSV